MNFHQSNRTETVKKNDKKSFTKKSTSVIMSISFGMTLLFMGCTSAEESKPAAIEAQKEFQAKLVVTEAEFKQIVEDITKEAEEASTYDLSNSSGINAQIQFQQKMEVETTKKSQVPDSIMKVLEQK